MKEKIQHLVALCLGIFNTPPMEEKPKAIIRPGVTDPTTILGENYGDPIQWEHNDDLFVEFQVLTTIVMDDVAFFMRYIQGDLSEAERKEYPHHFHPCFVELNEMLRTELQQPLISLNDDQSCYIAIFQNTMGLLLVSESDALDIRRRSLGMGEETDQLHYQLQFMRFDQKFIDKIDFAGTVIDHYHRQSERIPPLRVNFAKYNEIE